MSVFCRLSSPLGRRCFIKVRGNIGRSPKWQRNYGGIYLVVQTHSQAIVSMQRSKRVERLVHIVKLKCYERDVPDS